MFPFLKGGKKLKDFPRIFFSSSSEFAALRKKGFVCSYRSSLHYPSQSKKVGGVRVWGCGVFLFGKVFFVVVDSLNTGQLVLGGGVSVYQENMADAICSRKQNGRVHL